MNKIILTLCLIVSGIFLFGQDTINLNTFEVIGVRADKNTPISKMILEEKDIEQNYYAQELPLFLNRTPNVTSSTDGGHNQGYVYFRLRGIDQTRINMTLNGIPLNELEDQGVYFSNYPDFISSLNSMQIQRGVGTTSNGVTSYGGSINFEAKQGFDRYANIDLGYGSFNTHRFSTEVSTGMVKKTAFYTRFSHIASDGYKYHSGNNGYSFFLSGGYYGNKDVIKTIVFTGRVFNKLAWYAVAEDDIKTDPRTNYNTDRETDEFYQTLASIIYTRSIDKYSTFSSTIFYNRLDGNWDLDWMPFNDTVQSYLLNHNFYGLILNYNLTQEDMRFNTGLNLNGFNREHSSTILPNTDKLYVNTGYKQEYSWFAKIEWDIKKVTLFFDGQVRYTSFEYDGDMNMKKQDHSFFNPKFGITYRCDKKTNFYASVGKTSREATRTDIFGGVDNPSEYYTVEPESVIDYEVGSNYISDKIVLQTNFYYMDFNNEITLLGALGENGLPLMTNVDRSFRTGIELDFNWFFYRNGNVTMKYINNSSYSYNRIFDDGNIFEPLYTPNVVFNQSIWFENKWLEFGIENKIQGKSYLDFENMHCSPSFYTINTQIGYKISEKSSIVLRLNNITDSQYFTNGYVIEGYKYYYVNPPFNWFLTLRIGI